MLRQKNSSVSWRIFDMEFSYLISIFIFAALCWYIGEPLFLGLRGNSAGLEAPVKSVGDLALRKEEVMLTLKELEMDFKMKKISDHDYQTLYAETLQEGSLLVQQMDDAKNNPIKPDVPTKTKANLAQKFCTQCGTALVPQAKFCGECGHKI